MINGASKTIGQYAGHPNLGRLLSPRCGNSTQAIVECEMDWSADNDAFGAWDVERYWRMLRKIGAEPNKSRLRWVVCPDAVANHRETANLWFEWFPQLDYLGLPAAFALQNGAVASEIPWDQMAALFIGGCDEFKLSWTAAQFAAEAKERGKWVHMGRVNSRERLARAIKMGCDSVDGGSLSKWPDRWIPVFLQWIAEIQEIESRPKLF